MVRRFAGMSSRDRRGATLPAGPGVDRRSAVRAEPLVQPAARFNTAPVLGSRRGHVDRAARRPAAGGPPRPAVYDRRTGAVGEDPRPSESDSPWLSHGDRPRRVVLVGPVGGRDGPADMGP